jgi:phosphate acetyltransferase/phosphate butyryltransferase
MRARDSAASAGMPTIGLVYPCDGLAVQAAAAIRSAGIADPVLIGPPGRIARAAESVGMDARRFDAVVTGDDPFEAARRATSLAGKGAIDALMKGSLQTDELLSAVVRKEGGLRGERRISHVFVFDLPRYPKLLALSDCVVNIAPDLATKRDIVANALDLLRRLGNDSPKVGIVAAAEKVNPAIQATLDARALVELAAAGEWSGAVVEGPFGFDNAISAEAARVKNMVSRVAGDADLLVMPDVTAGNMLYKSFTYIGGGDCAGLVLGARVPIVLTSRADSLRARLASVALAAIVGGSSG